MIDLEISSIRIRLYCEPEPIYKLVMDHYRYYLSEGAPDYIVRIKWQQAAAALKNDSDTIAQIDGCFEQAVYKISSELCHGRIDAACREAELTFVNPNPLLDLDYFLRIVLSFGLLGKGGFLFHSAGVIRENQAFLFFGKSGSGKTTVAHYSKGCVLLSDDLVGVIPVNDGVMAYSTPFWNPGWDRREKAQALVTGVFRLVKSDTVAIAPLKESQAVSEIITSIPVIPLNYEYCTQLIPIVQKVIARVGVHYLFFKKDNTFWQQLFPQEGMG